MIGKAILFCRSPSGILIDEASFQAIKNWYRPLSDAWAADIPQVGTKIKLGQPILSLFVTGGDAVSVEEKLFEFANQVSKIVGNVANSFNG
jgi:predicted ATP-grasp superfamily ATP-dependent carboligase